jgi:RNA polymerase sigma-70 factor (ECF subfamily)
VDDDGLMVEIADGDEDAMQKLVARWERPVHAFLYHMLASTEDAEDLAQETFLRVFVQAERYRPQGQFRLWLLRIAGNLARSRLRRRAILRWVRFEPFGHDRADPRRNPQEELVARERRHAVRRAVAKLPWRQRHAVVLKRFEGLRYREIAAVLETTESGVESLLQRAARNLRRALSREGEES